MVRLSELNASEAASRIEALLFVSECGADMFKRYREGLRDDLEMDRLPRRVSFISI